MQGIHCHDNGQPHYADNNAVAKGQKVDSMDGHTWQPAYNIGGQHQTVQAMYFAAVDIMKGNSDLQPAYFVPVKNEAVAQFDSIKNQLDAFKQAVDGVDGYVNVDNDPAPEADSHNSIAKDELGRQYKAQIAAQHARLTDSLQKSKERILADIDRSEAAALSQLGQDGTAAAANVASKAAKATESRLGALDEHEHNETIRSSCAQMKREVTQKYDEAIALAEKFKNSATKAVDRTKDEDGADLVDELDSAVGRANAALNEVEQLTKNLNKASTKVKSLETKNKKHIDGEVKAQFQRNLAIAGMLIMTLVALGLGAVVMRGSGHTPIESLLKGLSPQQLKALEYGGAALAALVVGVGGIHVVKKGAPIVKNGIQSAWANTLGRITIS